MLDTTRYTKESGFIQIDLIELETKQLCNISITYLAIFQELDS